MHYLHCSENTTVLRMNDAKNIFRKPQQMTNEDNRRSEITIQSYWSVLTAAGFEPINCFRSIFWLVSFFYWTAQKMWKACLNYRLNILQFVLITPSSSVYVLLWASFMKSEHQSWKLLQLPLIDCSNNKQLWGNQNEQHPPITVLETFF